MIETTNQPWPVREFPAMFDDTPPGTLMPPGERIGIKSDAEILFNSIM
jgi:hypothetical protein